MKIGIFDSGLGGLIVTHSLIQHLPQYDYIYLGDTARVPYGNRSQEVIYEFTRDAVEFLFQHDCYLIILACNTASAEALRRIQQEYLPAHYPDRRVLGVLIPAAEEACARTKSGRVGNIATVSTVNSQAYLREIHKINQGIQLFQQAAPLLVPLVENNATKYADPILKDYLEPLLAEQVDTVILGCTHYPFLKQKIRDHIGPDIAIVSQDEIIPPKLADYLQRHPEIEGQLTKERTQQFIVTDLAPSTSEVATLLFGKDISLVKTSL